MKVLIIKTSSLGDIIHTLAVIDYLHQVSPGIEIDWVAEEQFLPVLEHNPSIHSDTVIFSTMIFYAILILYLHIT